MKKGLLICFSMAIGISAIAESNSRLPNGFRKAEPTAAFKNLTIKVPYRSAVDNGTPVNNLASRGTVAPSPNTVFMQMEEIIGYTYYDLQTNNSISNRLVRNSDNTISAAWTFSPNAIQTPTPFPTRGTGYNYWDGSTWVNGSGAGAGPSTPTEAVRTGFTNIVVTASGKEMCISHTGTGMAVNWRPTKGTGAWTISYPWGQNTNDTWPKAVAAGENVYVIFQGSGTTGTPVDGQDGPLYFAMSTDGGVTWGPKTIISEIDSTQYLGFGGDNYSIDARGNTVAITYGDLSTDVGLLKSTDNGQTWTKTIIQTNPIPFYDFNTMLSDTNADGVCDTLNTNSGDSKVLIDNNGMCHVWFSDFRWYNDLSTPGSYNYFPSTDGLFYWNETMPTDGYTLIAEAEDFNGNGVLDVPESETCSQPWGNYRGGLTQMPSAGVDDQNVIYLTYQTINESADTSFYAQAHRHIYMMKTMDNGATWSAPHNIVPATGFQEEGYYQEAVFACTAPQVVNNEVLVLYQRDPAPGHALAAAGTCDLTNNLGNASDIVLARVDSSMTINVPSIETNVFVSQNYPNPSMGMTYINVTMNKSADAVITVTDMMGKTVYSEVKSNLNVGANTIALNTSNWASGVYMYTVISGKDKVSKQMMVR